MVLSVVIVQHAEKERLPGDPGLTGHGCDEAAATARWLASTGAVAVYSGPLRRARETAAAIGARLGLAIVMDDRLRERMNWAEGDETLASFLSDWAQTTSDREFVPASGDSSIGAATRFVQALKDIAVRHDREDTVVVVTHGGVTTDLLRTLLGDAQLIRRAPSLIDSGVPCCALTRLTRVTDRWDATAIASTDHLEQSSEHRPA